MYTHQREWAGALRIANEYEPKAVPEVYEAQVRLLGRERNGPAHPGGDLGADLQPPPGVFGGGGREAGRSVRAPPHASWAPAGPTRGSPRAACG